MAVAGNLCLQGDDARPGDAPPDATRFLGWLNLAARQRMLSQRIGLLLLLAAEPGPAQGGHRDTFAAAVEDFAAAHRTLMDGDADAEVRLATPRVLAVWADGSPSARTRVDAFVREARQFIADLAEGRPIQILRRETFVAETCSDVLAVMDRIARAVEADLADRARRRSEDRRLSTERLDAAARDIAAARYARRLASDAEIAAVHAGA